MRRRPAPALVALVAIAAVAAVALLAGDGGPPPPRAAAPPARTVPPARAIANAVPARPRSATPRGPNAIPAQPRSALPRGPLGARVVRRTQLRERPGGRVVSAIGMRTGYDSPRILAVVARHDGWLAVLSDHMPNSRAAWIPAASAELVHEPYRLDVDLSARRLTIRRDGRVVRRVRVAIGAPGTSTPTGRFAVTDALRIDEGRRSYGCCALALTGRQPDLPRGWSTSDRLAIHGTPDDRAIGDAVSDGCLHAPKRDMLWMLRHVTLGAEVRIRA
jgi:lipoprotein-anchoring transpeptidase ErfK/SrfK